MNQYKYIIRINYCGIIKNEVCSDDDLAPMSLILQLKCANVSLALGAEVKMWSSKKMKVLKTE